MTTWRRRIDSESDATGSRVDSRVELAKERIKDKIFWEREREGGVREGWSARE